MNSYIIEEGNSGNFERLVLRSETPVLVDFWATWCAPCRTLAPVVEAIAEGTAHVVKLNVDDHPSVVQRYGIQAIPTLILFRDGEEKERIVGVSGREAISRRIERHTGIPPGSRETGKEG